MPHSALYSSYRRYKADSDYVVTWLATTAAKCGFMQGEESAHGSWYDRKVEIRDLLPMAYCIVRCTCPDIEIPEAFAYCLQETINERKRHQIVYRSHQRANNSAAGDVGHQYFIDVLENVQKVLQPKLPVRPSHATTRPRVELHEDTDYANIFGNLTVEGLSQEYIEDEAPSDFPSSQTIMRTIERLVEEPDPILAAIYLFRDFHRIRALIRAVWEAYRQRTLDLVTAAVTTNTAIDFMRGIQEDMDSNFSEPVDWHKYICIYCIYLRDTDKIQSGLSAKDDICLAPAFRSLQHTVKMYRDDSSDFVPTVKPAHVDFYGPRVDYAPMSALERNDLGVKIAMSIVPEYCLLTRFPKQQSEHEIIRGFREMLRDKKLIFWLTAAVQFVIEIRHILRENVTMGFQDLLQGADLITTRIRRMLKFHEITKLGKIMVEGDQTHRSLLDLVDRWTKSDRLANYREEVSADPSQSQHMPDYYLLKRDPLWCGLLLYNFRTVAYEGALFTANSSASILVLGHLYNAVRQADLLDHSWPSMEFVLSSPHMREIFIGNLPVTIEDCAKRLLLVVGLSPVAFARDRRQSISCLQALKAKRLSRNVPVSWAFKSRYSDSDGRIDLRPIELERILRDARNTPGDAARDQTRARLDPCLLLTELAVNIQQETEELTFDYFTLHRTCWKMLMDLNKSLRESNVGLSDPVDDEIKLPSLVISILVDAWRETKLCTATHSNISSGIIACPSLVHAAKVVEKSLRSVR